VWDVDSGREVQRFNGHPHIVYALAISPDGRWALSGSGREGEHDVDWTVCLWDIATGTELKRLAGRGTGVTNVAFSADGTRALIAEYSGTIRLMDVATWTDAGHLSVPKGLWSIALSSDGKRLLTAGGDGANSLVRMWNLSDGQLVQQYQGHIYGSWHAIFVPQSVTILSGGQDETMRQWDAESGQQIRLFPHDGQVARIAVSADGRYALAGTWGEPHMTKLKLWRLADGEPVWEVAGHGAAINAVAISADGRWAASGAQDGGVRLWRIEPYLTGKLPIKEDK
jgi:WD40 repeat protein